MRGWNSSVRIRLQRFGRKRLPFYRIVATHKHAPRDGKFYEVLGTYNPLPDRHGAKHVTLNVERIKFWLTNGAAPSERVLFLLGKSEIVPPPPRRHRPLLEEFTKPPTLRWDDAAAARGVVDVVDVGASGEGAEAVAEAMELDAVADVTEATDGEGAADMATTAT